MINIEFLGTWSALLIKGRKNVSFILNKKILFETGPHTLQAMLDNNLDPLKIETVIISHMHLDHYSGLSEFLWYRTLMNSKDTFYIVGPKGIKNNTEKLLKNLYTPKSFEIRAEYYEDQNFDFISFYKGTHSIDNNGYRIELKDFVIFYSGDTMRSENMVKGAEDADYLIHEMTFTDYLKKMAVLSKHSTYSDSIYVFEKSKAKYLISFHFTLDTENLTKIISEKNNRILFPKNRLKIK
ncbi:MAG: MBL fold metallo-hydrolase [Thermoplasmata archaeon]